MTGRVLDLNKPYIGAVALYVLTSLDASGITARRKAHLVNGNPVQEGDIVPFIVVRVWPHEFTSGPGVNGQAILDGPDGLWVTSAEYSDQNLPGTWHWPKGF